MKIQINPRNVSIEGMNTDETNECTILDFNFYLYLRTIQDDTKVFITCDVFHVSLKWESNNVIKSVVFNPKRNMFKGLKQLSMPFNAAGNEFVINLENETVELIER